MKAMKRIFPGYRLRAGRPGDAESLLRVHQRAVLTLGRRIYSDAQLESWVSDNSADRYVEDMNDGGELYDVALVRKAGIVAFCSRREHEVRSLYVDPDWARHGIGTVLLRRAEAAIAEAGHARVSIGASLIGLPFYEAQGYRVLRHRHWKTRGGLFIPAAEMEKALSFCSPATP